MLPKANRMRRRAEFIQATKLGKCTATPHFVLQFLPKHAKNISKNTGNYALGITASRKVGGAVQRNRAKRRLRAVLNSVLAKQNALVQNALVQNTSVQNTLVQNTLGDKPCRLVLVARRKCISAKFTDMQENLTNALAKDLAQNINSIKV